MNNKSAMVELGIEELSFSFLLSFPRKRESLFMYFTWIPD